MQDISTLMLLTPSEQNGFRSKNIFISSMFGLFLLGVPFLKAEKCVAVQQTDAALTMQYIMYQKWSWF